MTERFVVLGTGAVGGYFGGRLAQAGLEVRFLARGQTLAALREQGLRLESIAGDALIQPVQATADLSELGGADVVLVAVKTWQLDELLPGLPRIVGPATLVVPLLNGVEAPARLATLLGPSRVTGGLCEIGATIAAPGQIRHFAATPVIRFGELDGRESARLDRLAAIFAGAGIEAEHSRSIVVAMWRKFLLIVAYGGVGSLARVPLGQILGNASTRELLFTAQREVVALAQARGVDLSAADLDAVNAYLEKLPPSSTTSLQRDITSGKRSELEAWTGAVVRLAAESGVAVPLNATIYAFLGAQEALARAS